MLKSVAEKVVEKMWERYWLKLLFKFFHLGLKLFD